MPSTPEPGQPIRREDDVDFNWPPPEEIDSRILWLSDQPTPALANERARTDIRPAARDLAEPRDIPPSRDMSAPRNISQAISQSSATSREPIFRDWFSKEAPAPAIIDISQPDLNTDVDRLRAERFPVSVPDFERVPTSAPRFEHSLDPAPPPIATRTDAVDGPQHAVRPQYGVGMWAATYAASAVGIGVSAFFLVSMSRGPLVRRFVTSERGKIVNAAQQSRASDDSRGPTSSPAENSAPSSQSAAPRAIASSGRDVAAIDTDDGRASDPIPNERSNRGLPSSSTSAETQGRAPVSTSTAKIGQPTPTSKAAQPSPISTGVEPASVAAAPPTAVANTPAASAPAATTTASSTADAQPTPVSSPDAENSRLEPPPASVQSPPTQTASATPSSPRAIASAPNRSNVPANAAPAPRVQDEARIQSTLHGYVDAYEQLNASAAQAVWPGVDVRALTRAFDSLESQEIHFASCDLNVASASAHAVCKGIATYVPKIGSKQPRTVSREWTFDLKKIDDAWLITQAATR